VSRKYFGSRLVRVISWIVQCVQKNKERSTKITRTNTNQQSVSNIVSALRLVARLKKERPCVAALRLLVFPRQVSE